MKKKIAVTIGDPAGIGPEITLKALSQYPEIYESCIPLVFGHKAIMDKVKEFTGINVTITETNNLNTIDKPDQNHIICYEANKLETIPETAKITGLAGKLAFEYIKNAIIAVQKGEIDAIATAPINKEAMKLGNVPYLDHTEILTKLTDSKDTMTLFVTRNMRVFFYSRHITFKEISEALDKDKLVRMTEKCIEYLKKLRVENPKLAIAALNPHGGEHGMFGDEEINILIPAVEEAQEKGLRVEGPIPADSVFHLAKEGYFDAVLSLYHDQGHIAAKTYDFYHTISLTMGLPFLRTSVDHGTAMDMAGKNIANEISMVEAIKTAALYAW
jgi:4-phospho-D-threonate 3-dehydrogenase / 4-phospho-D-erythronate 3-dehydrogenase